MRIDRIARWERRPDAKVPAEEGVVYVANISLKGRQVDALALLRCPCGCGMPISYRLAPFCAGDGVWTLTINSDNTITLLPSMLKLDGCKSHFVIRNSKVEWC